MQNGTTGGLLATVTVRLHIKLSIVARKSAVSCIRTNVTRNNVKFLEAMADNEMANILVSICHTMYKRVRQLSSSKSMLGFFIIPNSRKLKCC